MIWMFPVQSQKLRMLSTLEDYIKIFSLPKWSPETCFIAMECSILARLWASQPHFSVFKSLSSPVQNEVGNQKGMWYEYRRLNYWVLRVSWSFRDTIGKKSLPQHFYELNIRQGIKTWQPITGASLPVKKHLKARPESSSFWRWKCFLDTRKQDWWKHGRKKSAVLFLW